MPQVPEVLVLFLLQWHGKPCRPSTVDRGPGPRSAVRGRLLHAHAVAAGGTADHYGANLRAAVEDNQPEVQVR